MIIPCEQHQLNLLFSSRTLHAMSCDGLFFRRVARVNAAALPLSRCSEQIVSCFSFSDR